MSLISINFSSFFIFKFFQIPIVADLPVGDNLQDHLMIYPFDYEVPEPIAITVERANSFYESTIYDLYGGGMKTNCFGATSMNMEVSGTASKGNV